MTHSHDVNNKKILEIIKESNFDVIHLSNEFEIRNFNYNEVLLEASFINIGNIQ